MASPASTGTDLARWMDLPVAVAPSVSRTGEVGLFVSDGSGLPRPWIVPLPRGEPSLYWPGSERVGAIQASPTGDQAIVTVDAGGDERWQLVRLDGLLPGRPPGVTVLTARPGVVHLPGQWREDGRRYAHSENARDPRFFDIVERDVFAPDRPPRVLLTGDGLHSVADAADGRLLVARATTNLDVDLFLVESERTVHLNPHADEVSVFSAALHGSTVFAATNPGRELAALVRYRAGSPAHEFLREYPGDIELVRPSPVGDGVVLAVNRNGWSELHLYDPSTGDDRVFNSGPRGVVSSVGWSPDGGSFLYAVSSVDGDQIYRRDVATGKERRIAGPSTTPAAIRTPMHGEVRASDRETLRYLEYSPVTPAKATVIWAHGGPEAQARPRFGPVIGCLVSRGFRIVAPNVRGSTGYGRRYTHLDDRRLRMNAVRDLAEIADSLDRQGKIGPGGLGIAGGSYGGFLVLAAAAEYPRRWRAAIDLAGIANLVTFLERTREWARPLREAEYGSLATDRDFLESISPVHRADRIEAPLLVIHGRNDPRVPISEAEQIVGAVRAAGRTVELLAFDDEGHGIVRRENRLVAWGKAIDWLETHLTPDGAGPVRRGPGA